MRLSRATKMGRLQRCGGRENALRLLILKKDPKISNFINNGTSSRKTRMDLPPLPTPSPHQKLNTHGAPPRPGNRIRIIRFLRTSHKNKGRRNMQDRRKLPKRTCNAQCAEGRSHPTLPYENRYAPTRKPGAHHLASKCSCPKQEDNKPRKELHVPEGNEIPAKLHTATEQAGT